MRVRRWAAFPALYLAVGLFLVLGPVCLDQARADEAEEQWLLELINGYRQDNDVGPLVPSEALSASAGRHSEDMSAHGFFSHRTRESSYYPGGSDPADRVAREGYPTNAATAENIALGQLTAEEVFEYWRRSPEHDAVMLDEQYTAVGVGHADSYWTADFGSMADTPSPPASREPVAETGALGAEQLVEPAAEEQTSSPQPADEQTSGGETRTEEAMPDPESDGEATPRTASSVQPTTGDATAEQYATKTGATETARPSGGEATPRLAPVQPTAEGAVTERYTTGETGPVEVLRSPDAGLAVGDPDAGTAEQEVPTTLIEEESIRRASPAETEAMETALAAREAVPEGLIWQASPAPEQPTGAIPAAGRSPVVFTLGASDDGVANTIPVATKKLPRATSGAPPLMLFVGGFLLLSGVLVHGAVRKRRGH